jgi:effector-binding domain-containing protein
LSHRVTVTDVVARPTAVVAATTTWHEFPTLWPVLLTEVWTCLRAGGVQRGCPNVMLYLDDGPHVEVGVELRQPCPLTGRVVASALPAGRVAMTVHRGPYAGLASAHQAVLDWCAAQGRRPAGPRWEIYGPHRDNPAELTTEVYHLLS